MAFFKKLFEKKECDLCGEEIGLLGNRKLEDGNCCKACAGKLSPWFEERRESTVAQIRAQLDYRARNAEQLKDFRPTKTFGDYFYMFVEERDGVPYRFCVSQSEDYQKENADLVLFENVEEVIVDIDGNPNEVYDKDGDEEISYDPPLYDYSFQFRITLVIKDVPWFDSIHFRLNGENPEIFGVEELGDAEDVEAYAERILDLETKFPKQFLHYKKMCSEIETMCQKP